ncbi:hypothetical protein [Phormidium sp. FACHB-592]|uniref:hypothetical protein n=1 Tax=Phormidium sp. FACHB-592 TaxID=2692850 RepID=UPI001682DF0D|nr:hypothetical protein [Phormidium sp. FACHB-592]
MGKPSLMTHAQQQKTNSVTLYPRLLGESRLLRFDDSFTWIGVVQSKNLEKSHQDIAAFGASVYPKRREYAGKQETLIP